MATQTAYQYSVYNDFPNHIVDSSRLHQEILGSDISVSLIGVNVTDGYCYVDFRDILVIKDKTTLDTIVSTHSGAPLPTTALPVAIESSAVPITINTTAPLNVNALPPSGLKRNMISMNWCDKTTWFYNAKPVIDETPTTTDGYRKVWKLAYDTVIDVYHGKLTGEASLSEMRVKVVLDGLTLTEQDPHYGVGGDYVVDYSTGTITLANSADAGTDPIVSYYREDGSLWIMSPAEGESWKLKGAESQFSEDVIMTDTLVYEVWAYNPYDLPNKVMVVAPDEYKTMYDFINDANKSYPLIPALGGPGWRGSPKQISVFAWDFQTTTDLVSSYGMELRVRLEHDAPFEGTFATGTFYFIRESE